MKEVKRNLKKTTESRYDFWRSLLSCRVYSLEDGKFSRQLLQGRRLRTRVPECRTELGRAEVKHNKQDKGKSLPLLQREDTPCISDEDWSRKARVLQEVAPRSHRVDTANGRLLGRQQTAPDSNPRRQPLHTTGGATTPKVKKHK